MHVQTYPVGTKLNAWPGRSLSDANHLRRISGYADGMYELELLDFADGKSYWRPSMFPWSEKELESFEVIEG